MENAGLIQELEMDGTLQQIISHEETEQNIKEDEESTESTAVNSAEESSDETEPLKKVDSKTVPRKFVEEEAREQGRVKTAVYLEYMKATGGVPFWFVAISAYAVLQALVTGKFNRFYLLSKSGELERRQLVAHPIIYYQ